MVFPSKNIKYIFLFSFVFAAIGTVQSQVTGNEDVDVVSAYNPILADAVKENFDAQIPANNVKPEKLDYNIPIDFYQIPYQPVKVKPIRLPDAPAEELDNIYVKAGFGTQFTPLAEVYINSNRNKCRFSYFVKQF